MQRHVQQSTATTSTRNHPWISQTFSQTVACTACKSTSRHHMVLELRHFFDQIAFRNSSERRLVHHIQNYDRRRNTQGKVNLAQASHVLSGFTEHLTRTERNGNNFGFAPPDEPSLPHVYALLSLRFDVTPIDYQVTHKIKLVVRRLKTTKPLPIEFLHFC